jgi:murein DD-endopeptidase MepM/ murein hydrolase activator NlpD
VNLDERHRALIGFLTSSQAAPARVCRTEPAVFLDWSLGAPPQEIPAAPTVGIGRYLEDRAVYTSDGYATAGTGERRTIHLGVDIFLPPGEPVCTPFDGTITGVEDRARPKDYGPVALLEHATPEGTPFFTLYGHLSRSSTAGLRPGRRLAAGDELAAIGDRSENGGWLPHLRFQLLVTHLGEGTAVWGVAPRSALDRWRLLSPDPNLILRIPGLRPAIGRPAPS